jgi:hypothetical protein
VKKKNILFGKEYDAAQLFRHVVRAAAMEAVSVRHTADPILGRCDEDHRAGKCRERQNAVDMNEGVLSSG